MAPPKDFKGTKFGQKAEEKVAEKENVVPDRSKLPEKKANDDLQFAKKPEAFLKPVVVHPIVLLSIVDHYNRVASGTNKRVVGCLLGEFRV